MSYDVYFEIDAGGPEPIGIGESLNYTYNCGPMFRRALGGDGINGLAGKNCGEVLPLLQAAVRHISDPDNAAEYRAMDPPNKWGDHAGAAQFLSDILKSCAEHPKATIRIC
jgi:hypothetical protein